MEGGKKSKKPYLESEIYTTWSSIIFSYSFIV